MKSYTFKHLRIFMSLLLLSIMVLQLSNMNVALADSVSAPPQQNANERYVAPTGNDSNNDCADSNNPCQTIQHAIDEAIAGETVLVEPGTYVENINFNGKNITVESTDGPDSTIIDGNQDGSVVTFENNEDATAVLQGFTITNGSGTYFAPYTHTGAQNHYGGGIFITVSSPTLANLIIEGNTVAGGGAGIWSHISEPTIVDSVIRNNTAGGEGGGIGFVSHNRRYPTLSNLLITGNSANWGGGALINYSTRAILTNVTISGNSATTSGGAIWRANNSNITVVNSIIWDNNPVPLEFAGGTQVMSEISYSNVEGGQSGSYINWEAGNLDVDPQFVDAANGDFRLSDSSPLLGVGTLQNAPATDLDGNARPSPAGSNPDLGAYESLPQTLDATLSCDGAEGYPGDTLLVDLIASGTDVYGLQVNSAVDPSIVGVQSGAFGDFFDSPYLAAINYADGAAGTWDGAASQQNPNPAVTGSGTFATVTYQAISPGNTDVTLTPLFSDRDGFELPGSATACTLTVLEYGSINGTVTYQGRLTHADIEVVATGLVTNNDLTDSNGDFDIGTLQAGDYQVMADVASYLPACAADVPVTNGQLTNLPSTQLLGGDVNDDVETDLVINIGDATRLGNSFGQPASADVQADINADGTINVQDLSILGGNYDVSGCQDW